MSLDRFIAGPRDDVGRLFAWYFSGDTDYTMPSGTLTFQGSAASAALLREARRAVGASVTGRRTFDLAGGWGGRHPLDVPGFVVAHTGPQEWVYERSPFTFVTDGVESAVAQARRAAGDQGVAAGTASIAQQCLKAGLLDEIHIDLVPVLLGAGIRLFDQRGTEPLDLNHTRVIEAPGVTHRRLHVVKEDGRSTMAGNLDVRLSARSPGRWGAARYARRA